MTCLPLRQVSSLSVVHNIKITVTQILTLAVKDTKSDFHKALHWLLISVPTANLAHAETIKLTNKTKAKVASQINGVKKSQYKCC